MMFLVKFFWILQKLFLFVNFRISFFMLQGWFGLLGISVFRLGLMCWGLLKKGWVGVFLWLFSGRKLIRWWILIMVLILFLKVLFVIEDFFVCVDVLFSCFVVIILLVMVLIILGLVMNMYELFLIMKMKLVIVGEQIVLFVQGFMMMLICGIMFEVSILCWNILVQFVSEVMFF